ILYEAFASRQSPALPELPVSYADFSAWHREWLRGPELERQKQYWLAALEGAPQTLALPTDKPRPPHMSHGGDTVWLTFSRAELDLVVGLARACQTTPFTVMLSAFQALLHRYAGQDDLLVGMPVRGRSWPEVQDVIGFFVNTVVLRSRVDEAT